MTHLPFRRLVAGLLASAAVGLTGLPALAQTTPAPAATPDTGTTAAPAATAAPSSADDGAPVAGAPAELLPDIVLGQENAPLTIIEYASYTCGHCAAFAKDVFPTLKKDYIDTGKVRFIQRPVYFDAVGLWAGILAQCDASKYYPVSEMLLTTQPTWLAPAKSGDEVAANLRKVGLAAGMTDQQMDACWADKAKVERMVATYQANATKDGLEGTPTFIIGGEKVPNQAWDGLKAKIDARLADAGASSPAAPAAN